MFQENNLIFFIEEKPIQESQTNRYIPTAFKTALIFPRIWK